MKKRILITGGAGYIGSHVLKQLGESDLYDLIVVDDLSNGDKKNLLYGEFIEGNIGDDKTLERVFSLGIDGILHFAGSVVVPESVENPTKYYRNNTYNSLKLLEFAAKYGVKNFIFSSTASVYGENSDGRGITEDSLTTPINPYAYSKLMTEQMIKDISKISPMNYVILRYFNVAGADPEGKIGQRGKNATHLIKVCSEAACKKKESVKIFGTDYKTKDGTGVRDYIHVCDLADVHVKALKYLLDGGESQTFNCGYSKGYSVREVVDSFQKIAPFEVLEGERRAGDISTLIADSSKVREALNWKPQFDSLEKILEDAYRWEKKL